MVRGASGSDSQGPASSPGFGEEETPPLASPLLPAPALTSPSVQPGKRQLRLLLWLSSCDCSDVQLPVSPRTLGRLRKSPWRASVPCPRGGQLGPEEALN